MYSIFFIPFQVDANAIFVDYSSIASEFYYQSVADIRIGATDVAK
jgi:hypothetical protein